MEEPPLKVICDGPANHWTDALPIGNGRLGAMVWGGVASELIQLNEDTLWTGTPGDYTDPEALKALPAVRNLVNHDRYAEATASAANLMGKPSEVYQLLGDLKLDFGDRQLSYAKETYSRELDLNTATVRVGYSVGDVPFSREYFCSHPHQVIISKLSASEPGALSFTATLDSQLDHRSYVKGSNVIVMEGSCPGKRLPPPANALDDVPQGIRFCAILDVEISDDSGVVCTEDGNKLKIDGSSWAVLRLVASSSFDGPFTKPADSRKDPVAESWSSLMSVKDTSYSELYLSHLKDYQNLFRRVSLRLSKPTIDADREVSAVTADRVRSFQQDEDPSLVELLFQFGRYLLISSSRPGTQVANLQGIWNKELRPKWDSAPTLNINLEMNYWPALPCNLAECQEPLFDFISTLSLNGSKTAEVNYGARGWVVHHRTDIWAKSSPAQGQVRWAVWPMAGAWLCTHLWDHYNYTLDQDFLRTRAYPLMEGCAYFLLDWLIDGGPDGYLETNPSTSPEHNFIAPDGKLACVSYSSTMDMEIIRGVFSAVFAAAEILGRSDDDLVRHVRKARARLRPTKVAPDGSIMEWARDFEDPEVQHRHLSHLFGLFPGHTITPQETPDLCTAAEKTLYKRGEEGPGWSTTWKVALWARLRNSEQAYWMVKSLFNLVDPDHKVQFHSGLYSNLFAAHPPFQIDANFGFAAAIAEMLVQSTGTDLYILPALPRDKWGSGIAKGLRARGGITVSLRWSEGLLHAADVRADSETSVERMHYEGLCAVVRLEPGKVHTFNRVLRLVKKVRKDI